MEQKQNRKLTEEEAVGMLKEIPGLFIRYQSMEEKWRQRFLDYCTGKKTLPVTYDPFFKRLFHPDARPGRLSRFLSSLLGQKVQVKSILPSEETLLDGGALLILDILVELEDGSLANVEVQKVPYLFPGERMSCYSSDLVLRQYSRVKGEKGKHFKYSDMKKVYTIVLFESSTEEFHEEGIGYIHRGKTVFSSGLKLELLQEYCLIALDVFRELPYPKDVNEQTGWLSLLAVEDADEAEALLSDYPWLEEIYRDMAEYLHDPQEVLGMFSEALKILDHNTVQYMIEEQQKEIEKQQKELAEKDEKLAEKDERLSEKDEKLAEKDEKLAEKEKTLKEKEDEIARLKKLLEEKK